MWLRHQEVEHRIFSEDTLWIGTDPDFMGISNLSVARPVHTMPSQQLFEAYVGKARVLFIVKYKCCYIYSNEALIFSTQVAMA